ncbi:MAG: DUF5320 domain-containing protein [Candidatus Woesearchaeota archaeon]
MNIYSLPEKVGDKNMPNLDGTGPEGKGPLTGRKRGKCKGAEPCPYGRGQGVGLGGGRGRRFQAKEE